MIILKSKEEIELLRKSNQIVASLLHDMKKRITLLAMALTILCSTSVYALDGTCNDHVQDRIGQYIESIESTIDSLEQLNDPVNPEIAKLLEDASADLAYARAFLEEGAAIDCAKARNFIPKVN